MTADEARHWFKYMKQPLIRMRRTEGSPGWMGGRMYSLSGEQHVMAKPFTHRRLERLALEGIHIWLSKLPAGVPFYVPLVVRTPLAKQFTEKPLTTNIGDLLPKEFLMQQTQPTTPKTKRVHIRYTEEKWNEARKLRAMGKGWSDIAHITGMRYSSLWNRLSKETIIPCVEPKEQEMPLAVALGAFGIEPRPPAVTMPSTLLASTQRCARSCACRSQTRRSFWRLRGCSLMNRIKITARERRIVLCAANAIFNGRYEHCCTAIQWTGFQAISVKSAYALTDKFTKFYGMPAGPHLWWPNCTEISQSERILALCLFAAACVP
jgi:hypothetical protein